MENELTRSVRAKGFEDLYFISLSGKIISKKNGYVRVAKGNPYNFTYVHLCKHGERELFKTYEVWKEVFGHDFNYSEYKGKK